MTSVADPEEQPAENVAESAQATADAVPTATSASGAGSPEDQLALAIAERDGLMKKWLMAVADLENYRKRVIKEMDQDRRYAALPLARDLLPALDNLQRALDAARNGGDVNQLAQGVQMVARQFD